MYMCDSLLMYFSSHTVTAEFNHKLVQSAPFIVCSPHSFKSVLSVTVRLQFVFGVTRLCSSSNGGSR